MIRFINVLTLAVLLSAINLKAQRFFRIDEREHPFQLAIGGGVGILKAGSAYSIKPLFRSEIGMNMHISPYVFVSERLSLGAKLGGIFRPAFFDDESNNNVQAKFTPYAMATSDFFLGKGERRVRAYIGLSAGMSYIGELEGRNVVTDQTVFFKRREKDWFLTIAPKAGIAFGTARLELEYVVTTPFNPDYLNITLIGGLPISRQKYY